MKYACILLNGLAQATHETLDLSQWKLVRRTKGTDWYPFYDNLVGTVDYGTFEDSTHDSTFTKKFDHETFTKFLFATGDLAHWGIIEKEAVYSNWFIAQSFVWISSSDDTTAVTWP